MKISLGYNDFKKLAADYPVVPVFSEMPGDMDTPVSAFLKLRKGSYNFLLESAQQEEKTGRFSFLGTSPELIVSVKGCDVEVYNNSTGERDFIVSKDPLKVLEGIQEQNTSPAVPGLPCFTGGLIGYVSYDFVRQIEKLPVIAKPDESVPDICFLLVRDVVIFDHFKRKLFLLSTVPVKRFSSYRKAYESGLEKLASMQAALGKTMFMGDFAGRRSSDPFKSNFPKKEFLKAVETAKENIISGDIVQAVISQRWSKKLDTNPVNVYRALRSVNPSPYMFFLEMGSVKLIGSSPEILVKMDKGQATVRPIAGTRRRGKNPQEEESLCKDLLNDDKEKAEHIMLVDLGRNDLGRVCVPGSIKVTDIMSIEKYSHVMHLVSNVEGRIKKNKKATDLLRATFPAGTVSGAPKVRAMEIIEEAEPERRGPYAGAVGYISSNHSMDFCITIRTIIIKDDRIYIQAGAGIVYDSIPEKEYLETKNKARGLMEACKYSRELDEMQH